MAKPNVSDDGRAAGLRGLPCEAPATLSKIEQSMWMMGWLVGDNDRRDDDIWMRERKRARAREVR
jgi:hypothetical protein